MKRKLDIAWLKRWQVIALALGCLIVGFVLGTFIFWKLWQLPPTWGDVATWLLVVLAAVGGWVALSQLRSQQEVIRQVVADGRRAQAARVFVGAPRNPGQIVSSYAKNASDFAVYEAQLWDLRSGNLSQLRNLGTILPGEALQGPQRFGCEETLARTVLTFRDANSVRWVRMPDGALEEQSAATARDSILAIASGGGGTGIRQKGAVSGS